MERKKLVRSLFAALLAMLLVFPPSVWAQQEQTRSEQENSESSEPVYASKVRSRATWEYIVNLPGYILYIPFWLVYTAVNPVIGWVDKSNVIPRINDFLTSDDGTRRLFPNYETQYGFGLTYSQDGVLKSTGQLEAVALTGLWWRRYFSLDITEIRLKGPILAGAGARYLLWTDAAFYGIGNDSRKEDRSNFAHRQPSLWGSVGLDFGDRFRSGLAMRFEQNSISPGRNSNYPSSTDWILSHEEQLPGLDGRADYLAVEFNLQHDSLFDRENSAGGWDIELGAAIYNQLNGDDNSFTKASLDVKKYFHLFYGRLLSFRLAAEVTRPYQDGEIPFYYLSRLGQRRTIRGFFRGRFQDRDSVLFSMEYQYPLIKRPPGKPNMGALLFLDGGKVAHDLFSTSLFGGYHMSFGGGFRIFNRDGLDFQVLLAKSEEGFRIYLVLNQ
jgi:hypothetical protein